MWRLAATLGVALHLGLTFLYTLPANPASQALEPLLDGTIGRFFPQNWSMFAPVPAQSNVTLLVACLRAGDDEATWQGPWADITTPLTRMHQQRRLSAYDRIVRAEVAAARAAVSEPPGLELHHRACDRGDTAACTALEDIKRDWNEGGREQVRQLASSYCKRVQPETARVGVQVRDVLALPWSKRHDPEAQPAVNQVLVGWLDVDPVVMAAPVYAGRP